MHQEFNGNKAGKGSSITVLTIFISMVISFFPLMAITLYATETPEPPEEILISNNVYQPDRKGAVYFSHLEHVESYDVDCDGCHHEYENGENIWDEDQPVKKCLSCHDPSKNTDRVKKLRTAFHKSCKGCHQKLAMGGGTDAPYKQCTDCHGKP